MEKKAAFETPILLIAWKRPHKTIRIINSLKKIKPQNFYVACDGPNKNDKALINLVNETRKLILENITWDCKLKTLFSESNQGCKIGVSNAINWFFENVDNGIILEDDCLPHQDFFYFCSELLKKYNDDQRIWSIAGNNLHNKSIGRASYFFSKYSHCWGWATWRRCWAKYDRDLKNWPTQKTEGILDNLFKTSKEKIFWGRLLDNIYYKSKPNTWDYQWSYTCFINSGLTIIPKENLIFNIGFDNESTHTKFGNPTSDLKNYDRFTSKVFPLKHPLFIHTRQNIEKDTEAICYSGADLFTKMWFKLLYKRTLIKIKIIVNNIFFINKEN